MPYTLLVPLYQDKVQIPYLAHKTIQVIIIASLLLVVCMYLFLSSFSRKKIKLYDVFMLYTCHSLCHESPSYHSCLHWLGFYSSFKTQLIFHLLWGTLPQSSRWCEG